MVILSFDITEKIQLESFRREFTSNVTHELRTPLQIMIGYSEILKAIRSVLDGGTYFPERITQIIRKNAHRWDTIPSVVLTDRERELLSSIAQGLTTKEIASLLKMSEATAETYRVRLMKKVGVNNTAALLAYAFNNGVL